MIKPRFTKSLSVLRYIGLACLYVIGLLSIVATTGSGGSEEAEDPPPPPPSAAPTISGISPDPVVGKANQQPITITGTGFETGLTVTLTWTDEPGHELPADQVTRNSESEVEIRVNTTVEPDNWTVKITNPDGQSSSEFPFTVEAPVIAAADGFDYPIGDLERYTRESDGDGWKTDAEFNDERVNSLGNTVYHLGDDWNAEGDPNPDDEFDETHPDRDLGQPIYAIANGTIVKAGAASVGGWGNVLIIRHEMPDGSLVESVYGHVDEFIRNSGDVVRGEQVATIGKASASAPAHLHLELRFSNASGWGTETADSATTLEGYDTVQSPSGWTDPSDFIDAHRPTLTISDGEFADWTSHFYTLDDSNHAGEGPGTSTGTAAVVPTGGNPGAHLGTTTTVVVGDRLITGAIKNEYELCHAGEGPDHLVGSYDPSDGAIETLSVTADLSMIGAGPSGWMLTIEQSGNIYQSESAVFSDGWTTASIDGLKADNFFLSEIFADPAKTQPDFSVYGDLMKFGISVSNSIQNGAVGDSFDVAHGIDNFEVTIARSGLFVDPVDCPRVAEP